jgi:hypothetical protein
MTCPMIWLRGALLAATLIVGFGPAPGIGC